MYFLCLGFGVLVFWGFGLYVCPISVGGSFWGFFPLLFLYFVPVSLGFRVLLCWYLVFCYVGVFGGFGLPFCCVLFTCFWFYGFVCWRCYFMTFVGLCFFASLLSLVVWFCVVFVTFFVSLYVWVFLFCFVLGCIWL